MRSGQALIVVLLALGVVAAVGLSVVSRSVTEINLASNQDASSQSLSAAESGIEAALQNSSIAIGSAVPVGTNSQYTVMSKTVLGANNSYQVSDSLVNGESATLFLRKVDANGDFVVPNVNFTDPTFTVCWGKTTSITPALEVTLYYQSGANYLVQRNGFDSLARAGFSNSTAPGSPCPAAYSYKSTVSVPANSILANFRILYDTSNSHPVQVVSSSSSFPDQGQVFRVQGQTGQTSRQVSVSETYPAPSSIFDNALFSGSNL
jgi:hypothetical protein